MIIPKKVTLDIMYRDSCNFKNCETYDFANSSGLSSKKIRNAIDKLISMEAIVPDYYGITNHPAPIHNEFFPLPETSIDHSFVEVLDVEFDEVNLPEEKVDDISVVVEAVSKPALVAARRKQAKEDCIKELQEHIESLKNMDL